MKKQWFAGLLVLIMLLLQACSDGSGSGDSPAAADKGGEGDKVTITYAMWDKNMQPAYEEIIRKFQDANPNIEVKLELTPWEQYWVKMEAAATGSALPDVFWMNGPNFMKYALNEMIAPIGNRVAADGIDLNNYPKALIDLYTYNGQPYALPGYYDTVALYYNKKIFDDAGLPYPDDTWDWAKHKEVAASLTDPSKGIYGFSAELWNQGAFYNTIFQAGGYVISQDKKSSGYDKPEAIAGLKFLTNMIQEGISPTFAQLSETPGHTLFESGKSALYFGGSWYQGALMKAEALKGNIGVTLLPKGEKRATVMHGVGYALSAKTKHPEEAWKFVNYLGSREAAEILGATGTTIPAFKGTEGAWVESNPELNLQVFIDSTEYGVPFPVSKLTSQWQEKETEILGRAWEGSMSIEDAAKQLAEEMNKILSIE
ncbi:ABC transporter substrate-binding protein [Paenibacillus aceti]|uniref:Sugar ABC transporter substrate-binding protein n=1 Tax=Paenibacillus aceti TaxID=1820010 RepID=A0ABQ1VTW8_9BACL|nr:sugar ABC transporter substrate-binding protein [Paenibacillus aceti]GGF93551.1 sugar ABC transporter substrate-binding protein [Paenibacillus aceti]